jgi:hypothetical protein
LREANQSERLISKLDVSKVDTSTHTPRDRERVTPGGPPASKREANAAAYLRAAQAYMLISMPTGTSTIFGVFQAILALLARLGECCPPYKLLRKEKFASEIFGRKPVSFYAAMQQEFTYLCDPMSNQWRINRFRIVRSTSVSDSIRHRRGRVPYKHLVRVSSSSRSIQKEWFDSCRGIFSTPGSATN